MTGGRSCPQTLEIIMDYSEQREQHIEDTRYMKWTDGMYVYLEDLECDYELAVIENSLRDSVYLTSKTYFNKNINEDCIGVQNKHAGIWWAGECLFTNLTRAQALYIATGDTNI
jgi:hypothetical protein